jgi:predicted DNA-binding protein (UPF0251 family)
MFDLDEVQLPIDAMEAIRLADLLGLTHEEAGLQMGVSRATFGRIVENARSIVADALINAKAIKVEGGNYRIMTQGETRHFKCISCDNNWKEPRGTGRPECCPACESTSFFRQA